MNIAITGACSIVARSVIELLDHDVQIKSILALDIRPYQGYSSKKVQYRQVDVRNLPSLKTAFINQDAVIHLAFVVAPGISDRPTIESISIGGTQNVLQAAFAGGVSKLVYVSSVAAYGAVPANSAILDEGSPLRGIENRGNFYYAYTKAVVEKVIDEFAQTHPRLLVTRFRSHILAGPNMLVHSRNLSYLAQLAAPSRSFWWFRPEGPNGSLLQCTHEMDLAKAIQHAIHHEMAGAYNIAGKPVNFDRLLQELGKTFRPIPWRLTYFLAGLPGLWSSRLRLSRSWLVSAKYRNILDCTRLMTSGFSGPLRSTEECVQEIVDFFMKRRANKAHESPRRRIETQ